MSLTSIKLSGFKSFADPVTIPIRSNLCGIVGPNGCGKSNIIDAVRWVIGESSAKQLRGKSMADVIFNGSNQRKPMGRALVELHFDNKDGRMGGEYASYSEISIRRELTRNGQSTYFINNSVCRRRDVLDIFLGTGLGPRSYAIIEQGMVSRLIEAKPDELRVFIEEAAGVSKYKERRRETQNRIKHTRENLDRVDDLLDELGRQQRSLQRQASAAERYQQLSAELKLKSAQLKALRWQSFASEEADYATTSQAMQTALEETKALITQCDTSLEQLQDSYLAAQSEQQTAQQDYYTTGSEVARIEQTLKHQREQSSTWQQERANASQRLQELKLSCQELEAQVSEITAEITEMEPNQENLQQAAQLAQASLDAVNDKQQSLEFEWDQVQDDIAAHRQQIEVSRNTLQHSRQQLDSLEQEQQRWIGESQQEDSGLAEKLQIEQEQVVAKQAQLSEAEDQLEQRLAQIQRQRQHKEDLEKSQRSLHAELQTAQGRHAALTALQEAAYGRDNNEKSQWLERQQINQLPCMAEGLRIEPGWETAVECVLGDYLTAICCESAEQYQQTIQQAELPDNLQVVLLNMQVSASSPDSSTVGLHLSSLKNKVQSASNLLGLLDTIYTADDRRTAQQYVGQLAAHESIITAEGDWFGPGWARLGREHDSQQGQLQRQQQLQLLEEKLQQSDTQLRDLEQQIVVAKQDLHQHEAEREQLQQTLASLQGEVHAAQGAAMLTQRQLAELQRNQARAAEQQAHVARQIARCNEQISQAEASYEEASLQAETVAANKEDLQDQRQALRETLQQAQAQAQYTKQQYDEYEIRLVANQNQLDILQQTYTREQTQLSHVTERLEDLTGKLQGIDSQAADGLSAKLEELLQQRLQQEEHLQSTSQSLTMLTEERNNLLEQRKIAQRKIDTQQTNLQDKHLQHKEVAIRQQTLIEQLRADGYDSVEVLLAELSDSANIDHYEKDITDIKRRIERLGAINLAAIDELSEVSERHEHLSTQHTDLVESLSLLEEAMAKIDSETKRKFQETFNAVNEQLQQLFPTIFGGGQAYLERVDVNDPTSGVLIRAQPPGKRNATIHMLSGGEKALTATALVFAMFQLNPAPFCILDEVDAPLDDVNVGRYCELIKKMSSKTQYLVISHSKITMSIVNQLLGVTMPEGGVSRLVAVDMQEAMAMSE